MYSGHNKNNGFLMKRCLMVSIIDGSFIDLKSRSHFKNRSKNERQSNTFEPPVLGKRGQMNSDFHRQTQLEVAKDCWKKQSRKCFRIDNLKMLSRKIYPRKKCENEIMMGDSNSYDYYREERDMNGRKAMTKFDEIKKQNDESLNRFVRETLKSGNKKKLIKFNPASNLKNHLGERSFQLTNEYESDFLRVKCPPLSQHFPKTSCIEKETNSDLSGPKENDSHFEMPKECLFFIRSASNDLSTEKPELTKFAAMNFVSLFQIMKELIYFKNDQSLFTNSKLKLRKFFENVTLKCSKLEQLANLLNKFLLGYLITNSDLLLSDMEVVIFCLFLSKKKYKIDPKFLWNEISMNQLRSQKVAKRNEQNYKLVLKPFLKKMIREFNRQNDLPINQENGFYKFHFESTCNELNLDWRDLKFQSIFNETRREDFSIRRIRSKKLFANIISKNQKIMKDLEDYINNQLDIRSYIHGVRYDNSVIIEKKLKKVMEKWSRELSSDVGIKLRLEDFVLGNLGNSKMKLPWGMAEVYHAVQCLADLFSK